MKLAIFSLVLGLSFWGYVISEVSGTLVAEYVGMLARITG